MIVHNKCTATLIDSMGTDLSVVNAARVSFDKQSGEFHERDERLINYLARNKHWSPFAQVSIQIRIDAPIFAARQWFKHQIGVTRNEMSRRYVDSEPEFYIPNVFHVRPAKGIKQGSGDAHECSENILIRVHEISARAMGTYQGMIDAGVAPEEARMILPQNTMTQWVETGSLAYYARACQQRSDDHAQRAIRQLASEVSDICEKIAPKSWAALMEKNG